MAGFWAFRRELEARGIPYAADAGFFGLIGGLLGAKLLFVVEHLGAEPVLALLTSRGGMSWFGGLMGGTGAGLLTILKRRWPWAGGGPSRSWYEARMPTLAQRATRASCRLRLRGGQRPGFSGCECRGSIGNAWM